MRAWPLALRAAAPALIAIVLLLPSWPAGLFYDDCTYPALEQAIASGYGFRYLNLPGDPAATHFPPLYPALLSVLWRASDSVETVSTLSWILNALLSAELVGLLATMSVLAAPLMTMALLALSERLFLLLALPGLWAAERARRPSTGLRPALLAGVLAALAYLTRSAALPLPVAAAVVYAFERRWRTLGAYLLVALPPVATWHLWVVLADPAVHPALAPNYGSYAAWYGSGGESGPFGLAWRTAHANLTRLPASFGVLVTPPALSGAALGAGVAALVLLARGALGLLCSHPVAAMALAGYLAIVLVWPFDPARFIHGVWPLLVLVLLVGVRGRGTSGPRAVHTVVAGVLAVGYVVTQATAYSTGSWSLPRRQAAARLVPTLLWVQEHTRQDDLIATGLDPAVYLYTGRRAIPPSSWASADYLRPPDPATLAARLVEVVDAFQPDFIIIQHRLNQLQAGLDLLLQASPDRLRLAAEFEDGTRVLVPGPGSSPP